MHDRELSFPNRRLAFGAGSRGAVNLRMVSPLDAHGLLPHARLLTCTSIHAHQHLVSL